MPDNERPEDPVSRSVEDGVELFRDFEIVVAEEGLHPDSDPEAE